MLFRSLSEHPTREEAERAAELRNTLPLHSIDITPEFKKSVMEKGQSLYKFGGTAKSTNIDRMRYLLSEKKR